jgi:hypothetical protein
VCNGIACNRVPPAGYTMRDETPEHLSATGRIQRWIKSESEIQVSALCVLGQGQDETWLEGFLEQTLVQGFVKSIESGSTTRRASAVMVSPERTT